MWPSVANRSLAGQSGYTPGVNTVGNDFGQRVRAALKARGLGVRAASRAMHMDPSHLSKIIHGKRRPTPAVAAAIDRLCDAGGTLIELARAMDADGYSRVEHVMASPSALDRRAVDALADSLTAQRKLDDVIGPGLLIVPTEASMAGHIQLLREARGPHRDALAEVVAEYVQFAGWLHASSRHDSRAVALLIDAGDVAKEIGSGTLLAQARNFRGYVARQQKRYDDVVTWFEAAYNTPGATAGQRMGDAAQAAQGYAVLGDVDRARRLLDEAASMMDAARDVPPRTAYWLTGDFQRLNLGLAHIGLGDYADAVDHLRAGLDGLPTEQQRAEWTGEYRDALSGALEHV